MWGTREEEMEDMTSLPTLYELCNGVVTVFKPALCADGMRFVDKLLVFSSAVVTPVVLASPLASSSLNSSLLYF